jgi:hypothetical protein
LAKLTLKSKGSVGEVSAALEVKIVRAAITIAIRKLKESGIEASLFLT